MSIISNGTVAPHRQIPQPRKRTMLRRSWRLRVAVAAPARRSPWAWTTLASRSLSTSDSDGSVVPPQINDEETPTQRKQRILEKQFAALPSMLESYIKATGHLVVPYHCPIPTLDQVVKREESTRKFYLCGLVRDVNNIGWPEYARGKNPGIILHKLMKNPKHQANFPHIVTAVRSLGYPVGEKTRAQLEWERQTMPALRLYYKLHGHSLVPTAFVVPPNDVQWPMETRGLRLGRRVDLIRRFPVQLTAEELEDLKSVEFAFDAYEWEWSQRILPSLEAFARVHGHCRVPSTFVVPATDLWPAKAWGLALGGVVVAMRSADNYAKQVRRDVDRLDAIKFVWDPHEYQWSERVLSSLEVYYRQHGDCLVPHAFVVPSEAPWPEEAWGLPLGTAVANMRSKGNYAKQVKRDVDRLGAINFVWDYHEYQWSDRVLPSLEEYYRQNGDCLVPQSFVVPAEAPWPQEAWGLYLGAMVSNIRSGAYAAQTARDADRLKAIEFAWDEKQARWDTVVLPALEAFFQIHGHITVPKHFIVPSEALWPERSWGLRLGVVRSNMKYRGDFATQREHDRARLEAIQFPLKSN